MKNHQRASRKFRGQSLNQPRLSQLSLPSVLAYQVPDLVLPEPEEELGELGELGELHDRDKEQLQSELIGFELVRGQLWEQVGNGIDAKLREG